VKAVLYARVSTDEQAEKGYSIPDQLRELRAHARKEGYEIIDEIVDDGYSGTDPRRPGLARVMELAGSRTIDIVIALERNRFYRSRLYRLLMDQDLEAYRVRLVALDDTGNRFGDAMTDEFAEWYREEVTENTRRGKLEKAKQGKVLPSRYPPYGFRYDKDAATYIVDPGKMENVKRLFHMIGTESKSMTAVKKAFEDEGIVSPGGAKYWSISTIRRLT